MKKKTKLIFIIIILILLIIIGILSYLLLFKNKEKLTINTNGGNIVNNIKIENDKITDLPVIEKEGYKVVAYINENKQILKKGSKVSKKTKISPVYVKEDEQLFEITFFDQDEIIEKLQLGLDNELILPENPTKEGFIFGGWLLEDDTVLIGNPNITGDTMLRIIWIPADKELVTITIIDEKEMKTLKQEKGKKILLPSIKKEGLAFEGWFDSDNNSITNETILKNDITIHGEFVKYVCPSDCIINPDYKTCLMISTIDKVSKIKCPSGTKEYYGKCMDLSKKESANFRQCDDWGDTGTEVLYNNWCVKRVKKITIMECPDGYNEENNICKKKETINCIKEI